MVKTNFILARATTLVAGNPTGKASVAQDRQSIRHFLSGLPIAGQIHSGQPFYEIHRPYIQLYRRQQTGKDGAVKNIEATDANLYLYDAPYNSLTVGGILFPKGRNRLESNALETALDSVLWQSFETDSLLLHSLKDYERNIGVLRSRPTSELTHIFHHTENPDSMSLDDIDRNSVNDTYYIKASVADSIMDGYEYGYLLDDKEVMELLQSYRGLLPEFSDNIGKKELRVLRKQFNRQKKSINRSFYRKVLPRNPYLAQIFYCKTGVMANDSLLNSTKVKKLKKRKVELTDFNSGYTALISKMKRLEDMYQRNLFRPVFIAGKKYYFIPKQLIL